ncbi:MAG: hypothetical protein NDI90_04320 [Nitrospira sp. BO4]|jgi:hypothetical protein|nr:hypothetical protein [Nitrospira sp. BO4]
MAPRRFQKVEVDEHEPHQEAMPEAPTTEVNNTDTPKAMKFGERSEIVNVPYHDSPRHFPSVNVTVNPAELQRGIAKQKQDVAKMVAQHEDYKRVPKGERTLTHKVDEDLDITTTTRLEH